MKNLRKYGNAPFNVAVIHGGPGASGEMASVARKLSSNWGVLEPLQTEASLDGQIKELHAILKKNGDIPVTLVGHSWGAMLSFIFTARYPSFVKKVILIGSGCFEEKYVENIMKTRLDRLSKGERTRVLNLMKTLQDPTIKDKNMPNVNGYEKVNSTVISLMPVFKVNNSFDLVARYDMYDPDTDTDDDGYNTIVAGFNYHLMKDSKNKPKLFVQTNYQVKQFEDDDADNVSEIMVQLRWIFSETINKGK